jgi:hypothetical protein
MKIKNSFNIRSKKYNNFIYYNIYLMMIIILKKLFDIKLFIRKEIQIKKLNIFIILLIIQYLIIINQL